MENMKLKPCPFCGDTVRMVPDKEFNYAVECNNFACDCWVQYPYKDVTKTTEAWNERAAWSFRENSEVKYNINKATTDYESGWNDAIRTVIQETENIRINERSIIEKLLK